MLRILSGLSSTPFLLAWFATSILPGNAAGSALACVKEHLRVLEEEGETTHGISETKVESLLWDISIATDLPREFMAETTVLSCPYIDKAVAYFPNAAHVDVGVPKRNYFIYDADWTREVIGSDNWQAIALFGHELGHFWLSHFEQDGRSRAEKEEEADQFAGCVVAKLGGPWEAVEDLLSRIRRSLATSNYPDRLKSLESARLGFDDCSAAPDGGSEPVNTVSSEALSELISYISREGSSDIGRDEGALLQTLLNSLGFDAGPVDGQIGRRSLRAVSDFQRDMKIAETGEIDKATVLLLAQSYRSSLDQGNAQKGRMPGASMSEKAKCVARVNPPSGYEFFEVEYVESDRSVERISSDAIKYSMDDIESCRKAVLSDPDNVEIAYRYGLGLFSTGQHENFLESWYWITNAAMSGHVDARYSAGLVYDTLLQKGYNAEEVYRGRFVYDGDERSQVASRARDFLSLPAEDGNAAAMLRLVNLEYDEKGSYDDRMRDLLNEAAALGLPQAQYDLYWYHATGQNGFAKSRSAESYWQSKALESGHVVANAFDGLRSLYGWPTDNGERGLETSLEHRKKRARAAAQRFLVAIEGGYQRLIYVLENLKPDNLLAVSLRYDVASWEGPCARRGFDGVGISCLEYVNDPNANAVIIELFGELQRLLTQRGLYDGSIDRKLGGATKEALLQLCDCEGANGSDRPTLRETPPLDTTVSPIAQKCLKAAQDGFISRPFREKDTWTEMAASEALESCAIARNIFPNDQHVGHAFAHAAQRYHETVGADLPTEPFYLEQLLKREYASDTLARSLYGQLSDEGFAPSQFRYFQLAKDLDGYSESAINALLSSSDSGYAPAQYELSKILMSGSGFTSDRFGAADLAYKSILGGYFKSVELIRTFEPDLVEIVRGFLRDDGYWEGKINGEFDRRTELALLKACDCFEQ
ncbi:MAG: peptidoglycan-binding protein [Paracoccaceae bacterium]